MSYGNTAKHKMCARPAHAYPSQKCQIGIRTVIRKSAKRYRRGYLQVFFIIVYSCRYF